MALLGATLVNLATEPNFSVNCQELGEIRFSSFQNAVRRVTTQGNDRPATQMKKVLEIIYTYTASIHPKLYGPLLLMFNLVSTVIQTEDHELNIVKVLTNIGDLVTAYGTRYLVLTNDVAVKVKADGPTDFLTLKS